MYFFNRTPNYLERLIPEIEAPTALSIHARKALRQTVYCLSSEFYPIEFEDTMLQVEFKSFYDRAVALYPFAVIEELVSFLDPDEDESIRKYSEKLLFDLSKQDKENSLAVLKALSKTTFDKTILGLRIKTKIEASFCDGMYLAQSMPFYTSMLLSEQEMVINELVELFSLYRGTETEKYFAQLLFNISTHNLSYAKNINKVLSDTGLNHTARMLMGKINAVHGNSI